LENQSFVSDLLADLKIIYEPVRNQIYRYQFFVLQKHVSQFFAHIHVFWQTLHAKSEGMFFGQFFASFAALYPRYLAKVKFVPKSQTVCTLVVDQQQSVTLFFQFIAFIILYSAVFILGVELYQIVFLLK
jgi:hypothetical protein